MKLKEGKTALAQQNFHRKLVELTTVQVYTTRRKEKARDILWFYYNFEELVFSKMLEEKELVSIAPSDIVNIDFRSFGETFSLAIQDVPDDIKNERFLRIQVLYPDTKEQFELIARANQYEDIKNKILQAQA